MSVRQMMMGRKPAAGGDGITDPTDIADLWAWWDADDISTLYQTDTTASPVSSDGDSVGRWDIAGGSAGSAPLAQTTAAARATYKTGVQNGKPVVRFDGTNDFLTSGTTGLTQPNTLFLVFDVGRPWENGLGGTRQIAGSHPLYAGSVVGSAPSTTAGTFITTTSQFNGASSLLRVSGSAFSSGNAGSNGQNRITPGRDTTPSYYSGDVAEIVVYDVALSLTDIQSVEDYLITKWGL